MQLSLAVALFASLALASAGCSDSTPPSSASKHADELEQKAAALDQRLKALSARIQGDELEAKYHDSLAALEEQRVALRQQIERLGDKSSTTWDSVKAESEKAYSKLEQEMEALAKKIDDAVAKSKG